MIVKQYSEKNLVFGDCVDSVRHKARRIVRSNSRQSIDLFLPLRQWLNKIEIRDRNFAHRLCQAIPNQCPFARDIALFGHTILSIPPLCKLNPLYNEVVALRFRAICYLADVCGEDVSSYC